MPSPHGVQTVQNGNLKRPGDARYQKSIQQPGARQHFCWCTDLNPEIKDPTQKPPKSGPTIQNPFPITFQVFWAFGSRKVERKGGREGESAQMEEIPVLKERQDTLMTNRHRSGMNGKTERKSWINQYCHQKEGEAATQNSSCLAGTQYSVSSEHNKGQLQWSGYRKDDAR